MQHEVDLSRKECPFVIKPKIQRPPTASETEDMDTDMDCQFPLITFFPLLYLSDLMSLIFMQSVDMKYKNKTVLIE